MIYLNRNFLLDSALPQTAQTYRQRIGGIRLRDGALEELVRELARGIGGARRLPEILLHAPRFLARHVPLEEHLQGELA